MPTDDRVPGTLVPRKLAPWVGEFVILFSSMEGELNRTIWHVAGVNMGVGRAFTASIQNYYPRAQLLGWLAEICIADEKDQKKIKTLSKEFMKVAEYRNRILHDEVGWYSPSTESVGMRKASVWFQPSHPKEVSEGWLGYMSNLCWEVTCRLQQYHTKNERWQDDQFFPWHDKPLSPPPGRKLES